MILKKKQYVGERDNTRRKLMKTEMRKPIIIYLNFHPLP